MMTIFFEKVKQEIEEDAEAALDSISNLIIFLSRIGISGPAVPQMDLVVYMTGVLGMTDESQPFRSCEIQLKHVIWLHNNIQRKVIASGPNRDKMPENLLERYRGKLNPSQKKALKRYAKTLKRPELNQLIETWRETLIQNEDNENLSPTDVTCRIMLYELDDEGWFDGFPADNLGVGHFGTAFELLADFLYNPR
eukprot:TRINITY_DN829_c0_g1_i10.p1 TRINITY_DN829_c0_g1~~TRINITY_DN829_c0_g1_i10.p1  ORF type:complete len:195 (+),score=41.29 TRINITY_DN829_c0_g1_i10:563-1147(+)